MKCLFPLQLKNRVVNCGQCRNCRINKLNEWLLRAYIEMMRSKLCLFVTLTYRDECLRPINKRDCQLFFKRFRKNFNVRCKYLLVADYGERFLRPHYHFLLFLYEKISDNLYYYHKIIFDTWQNGKVHIGILLMSGVRYALKYVFDKEKYSIKGLPQPFMLVSKGFGRYDYKKVIFRRVDKYYAKDYYLYLMRYRLKKRYPFDIEKAKRIYHLLRAKYYQKRKIENNNIYEKLTIEAKRKNNVINGNNHRLQNYYDNLYYI